MHVSFDATYILESHNNKILTKWNGSKHDVTHV